MDLRLPINDNQQNHQPINDLSTVLALHSLHCLNVYQGYIGCLIHVQFSNTLRLTNIFTRSLFISEKVEYESIIQISLTVFNGNLMYVMLSCIYYYSYSLWLFYQFAIFFYFIKINWLLKKTFVHINAALHYRLLHDCLFIRMCFY